MFKQLGKAISLPLVSPLNSCLESGLVPFSFKDTIIIPLLRKPGADPSALKNDPQKFQESPSLLALLVQQSYGIVFQTDYALKTFLHRFRHLLKT